MFPLHRLLRSPIPFAVICLFLVTSVLQAQPKSSGDTSRGIELYHSGQFGPAVASLQRATKRDKDDAVAWHYLALALENNEQIPDAIKAHRKAASFTPDFFFIKYRVAKVEGLNRWFLEARSALAAAAASAERLLQLDPAAQTEAAIWRTRIAELTDWAAVVSKTEAAQPAQIIKKSVPLYTEAARRKGYGATTRVVVILGEDGTVRRAFPLKRLKYGLTEMVLAAAAQIQFVPARANGKPVSQLLMMEYNYNIY